MVLLQFLKLTCIFRKGKLIASGANDGQIQIWDQSRTVAPRIKIQNAHKPMLEISNVTFSYDNTCLSSRGADGSVKIWDLRNTKKVLVERTDLPSMYHCTQEMIQTFTDRPRFRTLRSRGTHLTSRPSNLMACRAPLWNRLGLNHSGV